MLYSIYHPKGQLGDQLKGQGQAAIVMAAEIFRWSSIYIPCRPARLHGRHNFIDRPVEENDGER
jgi:hypothetical protein